MLLDVLYADNLEELQDVVEQLTETILCDYKERVEDKHFDPSLVPLGRTVRLTASVRLEDGSAVYDIFVD